MTCATLHNKREVHLEDVVKRVTSVSKLFVGHRLEDRHTNHVHINRKNGVCKDGCVVEEFDDRDVAVGRRGESTID